MTLHTALAVAALAGSALLFSTGARVLATVTLIAAAAEVLMALGVLQLRISQLPLGLVLGLALAVPGLIAWFRATAKTAVSAAAVVSLVGVLQVVAYAGLRR